MDIQNVKQIDCIALCLVNPLEMLLQIQYLTHSRKRGKLCSISNIFIFIQHNYCYIDNNFNVELSLWNPISFCSTIIIVLQLNIYCVFMCGGGGGGVMSWNEISSREATPLLRPPRR